MAQVPNLYPNLLCPTCPAPWDLLANESTNLQVLHEPRMVGSDGKSAGSGFCYVQPFHGSVKSFSSASERHLDVVVWPSKIWMYMCWLQPFSSTTTSRLNHIPAFWNLHIFSTTQATIHNRPSNSNYAVLNHTVGGRSSHVLAARWQCPRNPKVKQFPPYYLKKSNKDMENYPWIYSVLCSSFPYLWVINVQSCTHWY